MRRHLARRRSLSQDDARMFFRTHTQLSIHSMDYLYSFLLLSPSSLSILLRFFSSFMSFYYFCFLSIYFHFLWLISVPLYFYLIHHSVFHFDFFYFFYALLLFVLYWFVFICFFLPFASLWLPSNFHIYLYGFGIYAI